MRTKYIIFDGKYPIILSEESSHNEVSDLGRKPTSAGFVNFFSEMGEVDVYCYGRSESLNIGSNPDNDRELILKKIIG